MPSFLSKVFGRKKSDDSPSSSSAPKPIPSRSSPSLLDGKYEAVSPTVSPSAARFQLPRSQQQRAPHLSLHFPARAGNDTDVTRLDAVFEDAGVPGDVMLSDEVIGRTRLGIKELLPLVKACSQAITERGLETLGLMHPHWYSASPSLQRKLISLYLLGGPVAPSAPQTPSSSAPGPTASTTTPGISEAFTFHLSSASPHDAASVLRWACRHFSNTPPFGASSSTSSSESYTWYTSYATAEQSHDYSTDAYPTLLSNHLSADHLELLGTILDLTSRLAAHAEASGVSGSKFAKLVGPWLLAQDRIGSDASTSTKGDFTAFYGEWDTAGRIFEHLFLARLRSTAGALPKRLATLVNGYPWGSPVQQGRIRLLAKPVASTRTHEAFLITIDSLLPNTAAGKPSSIPSRHPLLIVHDALHALPTNEDEKEHKDVADAWEAAKFASKEVGDVDALAKRVFAEETLNLLSLVPLTSGSTGSTTLSNAALTSGLTVSALSPDMSTSSNSHRRSMSASASTSAGPSSLSALSSAPALSASTSQTTAPGSSTSAKPSSPVDLLMHSPRSRASAAPAWTFTDWSEFQALGFTGPPDASSPAGKSPEAARSEEALNLAATLRETDPYVEVTRPASPSKGGFGGLSRRGSQKRPISPGPLGGSKKGTPRLSLDIPASPSASATQEHAKEGEEDAKAKEVRTVSVKLVKMDEAFVDAWADALTDPAVTRAWPLFVVAQLRNPVSLVSASALDGEKENQKGERKIGWVVLERTFTRPAPVPRVQVQPPAPVAAASQSTATLTSEGGAKDSSSKGKEKKGSKSSTPNASPRPSIGAERMSSTLSATKRRLGGFGGLFSRTVSGTVGSAGASGEKREGGNLEREGSKSKKAKKEKRKSGAANVGEMGEILKEEEEGGVDAAQVPLPSDNEEVVKTPPQLPAALAVPNLKAEEHDPEDDKGRFIERFTPGYTPRPSDLTPKDHQELQAPAEDVKLAESEDGKKEDTKDSEENKEESKGLGSTVVAAAAGVAAVAAGAAATVLPSALGGAKAQDQENNEAKEADVHEQAIHDQVPTQESKTLELTEQPEVTEPVAVAPTVEKEPIATTVEDHVPAAPTPPPETAPVVEELARALDVPTSSDDVPAAEIAQPEVAPVHEPEATPTQEPEAASMQEAIPEETPYTLAMGPTPEELVSSSTPAPEAPTSPPPTKAQAEADEPSREETKSPQVTAVFSSHLSPNQAVREVPDTEDLRPDSQLSLRSPPPFVPFASPTSPKAPQDEQTEQQAQQDVEVEEITLQTPVAEKLRADYLLDRPSAVVAPITPAVERPREEVEVQQEKEAEPEPEPPVLQVPEPVEATVTPEVVETLEKAAAEGVENIEGGPIAGGDVATAAAEDEPATIEEAKAIEPSAVEESSSQEVTAQPVVEAEAATEESETALQDNLAAEAATEGATSVANEEPRHVEESTAPASSNDEPVHATSPEIETASVHETTTAEVPHNDGPQEHGTPAIPQDDDHEHPSEPAVQEEIAPVKPPADTLVPSEESTVKDETVGEHIVEEVMPEIAQELASVEEPVAVEDVPAPVTEDAAPITDQSAPVADDVAPVEVAVAAVSSQAGEPIEQEEATAVGSEKQAEPEDEPVAEPEGNSAAEHAESTAEDEVDVQQPAPVADELPAVEVPAPSEVAPAADVDEHVDTQEPVVAADAEVAAPAVSEEPTNEEPVVAEEPVAAHEPAPVEEPVSAREPIVEMPAVADNVTAVHTTAADAPVSEEQSAMEVEDIKDEPSTPDAVEQKPIVEEFSAPVDPSDSATAVEESISSTLPEDVSSSAMAAETASAPADPPAEPEGHSIPTDMLVATASLPVDDAKSEIHMPVVEAATNPPPTDSNAEEPTTAIADEVQESGTPAKDIELLAEQVADIAEPSPAVHEHVTDGAHERSLSHGTVGEDEDAEENGDGNDDATSPTSPTEPTTPVSPSTPSASKKNKKKKKAKK